jgi:hypothetical protein
VTTEQLLAALARIEESVRASDGEAILARWDFGREVLGQRVGKQLPKGLLGDICERTGLHHTEISFRVRVAEHYDRPQLETLVSTSQLTWTAVREGLPKKRKPGVRSPKPPSLGPTAATFTEADRVQALIVKPDVAAEIARRAKTDAAAAKAQKLIEKRERDEAKAQKERDQEAEQRAQVLRARLVRGDADWQNLTEQMETTADTLRRLVDLLDGLPTPDDMHRKMFDRQLAVAQQALFELRQHLTPNYDGERPAVSTGGVIEVVAR